VIVGNDAQEKDIEETHPEGSYYLYHDREWRRWQGHLEAHRQRNARLDYEEFRRLQGTARVHNPAVVPIAIRRTLADTVEDWRGEIEANKKHKTCLAYKKSTEYFLQSCAGPTVESVDRRDMLNFKIALKGKGLSKRSVYNNFLNVMIFFKWRVEMKEEEHADWDAKTQGSYRYVTVPAWLNQKIEQRMKARRAKRTDLVFPAPRGGVNTHLLRIVKRVAKRARLA